MIIKESGSYEPRYKDDEGNYVDNRCQWLKVDNNEGVKRGNKLLIKDINRVRRVMGGCEFDVVIRDIEYNQMVLTVIEVEKDRLKIYPAIIAWGDYKNASNEYRDGMKINKL